MADHRGLLAANAGGKSRPSQVDGIWKACEEQRADGALVATEPPTARDLQILSPRPGSTGDEPRSFCHYLGMDKLLHVGFNSDTLTFSKDITVQELIELLNEYAPTIEELMRAARILGGSSDAGRFAGTGYLFGSSAPLLSQGFNEALAIGDIGLGAEEVIRSSDCRLQRPSGICLEGDLSKERMAGCRRTHGFTMGHSCRQTTGTLFSSLYQLRFLPRE